MMSERTMVFGANNGLVGTLALPAEEGTGAPDFGLVLLNAGVVHRVGPHRINVRLARQLAARRIPSIRFDLSGHGDSLRGSGQHSFEEQAVIDLRSAMDAFGAAANLQRFAIFGYCSGAYHAFETALVDERIAGILMFDAYRYPTIKMHAYRYMDRLRRPRRLRAVASGLKRGIESVRRKLLEPAGARDEPELDRVDFIPSKTDFATGLRKLLDRGVKVHLIYSGGQLREYNYSGQFRDAFAGLGIDGRVEAAYMPELDHVASTLADQADLMRRVVAWASEIAGDA
jgi:pimeloyl-ACP methyl ester carboxylesterase